MSDLELPIFYNEPIASLQGVMRFPKDLEKAEIYAAWFLGCAIGKSAIDFRPDSSDADLLRSLFKRSCEYPKIADEAGKNVYAGTQARALVSYLWHAVKTGVAVNQNDATIALAALSWNHRQSGVRSNFLKAKSDFSTVLHFWGILSIQYDNDFPADFKMFCSQSEALLQQMRKWEAAERCRGTTFSSDKYHVPTCSVDWRVDCRIRIGNLPSSLMPESKKHAGRPPKNPVRK